MKKQPSELVYYVALEIEEEDVKRLKAAAHAAKMSVTEWVRYVVFDALIWEERESEAEA